MGGGTVLIVGKARAVFVRSKMVRWTVCLMFGILAAVWVVSGSEGFVYVSMYAFDGICESEYGISERLM